MHLVLTEPPAAEPITLAEAKGHLRVLHASEDALIERIVAAVRAHVEKVTGRALIAQGWSLFLPAFPKSGIIELPRPPLIEVTEIRYRDAAGEVQMLAESVYTFSPLGLKGWVQRRPWQAWPATAKGDLDAVEVRFTAGYGDDPADVPPDLNHAMLLLIGHLYSNRDETSDKPLAVNPVASDRLLGPFRTHGWI